MVTNSSPPISALPTRMTGALLAEFLADELVRGGDAHGALDAGSGFERFQAGGDVAARADHADHNALLAFDRVDAKSEIGNTFTDMVNLLLRGMQSHRNNHYRKTFLAK
jgi:predicted RNA-binding Zn ribbon-like protein